MICRTGGIGNNLFGRIGWSTFRRTPKGKVTSSAITSVRKVKKLKRKRTETFTCVCRDVDLAVTDHETENAGDGS